MAITISGENNNDKILATDGVIDQISGINIVGLLTAGHLNVGSNIQLGNAGIVTATTFVGNLTGNVNSTSPLLLQTGGSERFRITGNNELGIAGANYGTSGQVLTSGGSGSAVSWTTIPTQVSITGNADNRIITGGSGVNLNGEANLTFNGSKLHLAANSTAYDAFQVGGGLFIGNTTNNVSAAIFHQGGGADLEIGAQDMITFTTGSTAGNATERLRITSDGKVSIGGFNPSVAGLSISNSSTNRGFEFDTGSGFDSTSCIRAYDRPTTAYKSLGLTGSDIRFGINDVEKVRITSAGDVVINDTTADGNVHPDTKLHVKGGITFRELTSASENALPAITQWSSSGTGQDLVIGARSNNGAVLFYTGNAGTDGDWGASSNAERLRITSGGQVRIGNSDITVQGAADDLIIGPNTPAGDHGITIISGTSGTGNIYFADTNTASYGNRMGTITYYHNENYMRFSTNGNNERLRITSDGNVGINETAPSEKLQIDGDILLGGQANSGTSDYAIKFEYNNHQFAKIVGDGRDSSGYGDIDFYTSPTNGATNLTQRMSIRADGKIGIVDATNNGTISAALHVINSTPEIRLTNTSQPNSADCGKIRITEYANSYMGGYMHYDGNSNVLHLGVHEPNDSSTSNDVNSISIDRDTGRVYLSYEGNTKLSTTNSGVTIDSGTTTLVRVSGDSSGTAGISCGGDSGQTQCTGYLECHQDQIHGGGMFYNGDGSPSFATHESNDYFSLYRMSNGTRYSVMRWYHSGQDCEVQGNMTIDNGYTDGSTVLKVRADSSGTAGVRIGGDSSQNQCTGFVEVHQDESHGGGMMYNGDGSPAFVSGETADRITFYRMTNGGRHEVFNYPHNSNNVEFNGSITENASDIRLKTNIKIIDNPIEKIKKIRGTTFDWVDDITSKYGFIPSAKHETGVIAQEIQDVVPDAVVTAPFNTIYTEKSGKDHNFLTVKSEKIIPLCIEAIKELSTEVENLKAEIAALKSS